MGEVASKQPEEQDLPHPHALGRLSSPPPHTPRWHRPRPEPLMSLPLTVTLSITYSPAAPVSDLAPTQASPPPVPFPLSSPFTFIFRVPPGRKPPSGATPPPFRSSPHFPGSTCHAPALPDVPPPRPRISIRLSFCTHTLPDPRPRTLLHRLCIPSPGPPSECLGSPCGSHPPHTTAPPASSAGPRLPESLQVAGGQKARPPG